MTLTLRPVPRRYSHALEQARADTHRRLRCEIEESRISREQSEGKIARHFKAHRIFQLTGETA